MIKMNPEIKAEWVKRLRDGREQTSGVLTRVNDDGTVKGQCCLGVLCEIAVEHEVTRPVHQTGSNLIAYSDYGDEIKVGILPERVGIWAGFAPGYKSTDPRVPVGHGMAMPLTSLNDNGKTFAEIADLIEKGL